MLLPTTAERKKATERLGLSLLPLLLPEAEGGRGRRLPR